MLHAVQQARTWIIVSLSIYGGTLLVLHAASFLYHLARGKTHQHLRTLDHCAIYLLIAGTYTPFSLVTLRGGWGWILFRLRASLHGAVTRAPHI